MNIHSGPFYQYSIRNVIVAGGIQGFFLNLIFLKINMVMIRKDIQQPSPLL